MAQEVLTKSGSFRDIRAFAEAAEPATSWQGDAYLGARRALEMPEGPISIAAVWLDGSGVVQALPADEFVCVLAGELTILHDGEVTTIAKDASAVLPGAMSFEWSAQANTRAVIMRCSSGPAGTHAPVSIDETAPLNPSNPPRAELLVGETPSCRAFSDYKSASGEFSCGTWDSTPYHRTPMLFGHCEMMHILEGEVTFADEKNGSGTFGKGSIVFLEEGSEVSWNSTVYVKKVFSHFRAAD